MAMDPERIQSIAEEMGNQQQVMQQRRVITEMWLHDNERDISVRHWTVGSGDLDKKSGPIEDLDGTPGRVNIRYKDGRIKTIFYNPERFEMSVLHEAYVEPLISIPQVAVDGNIIG